MNPGTFPCKCSIKALLLPLLVVKKEACAGSHTTTPIVFIKVSPWKRLDLLQRKTDQTNWGTPLWEQSANSRAYSFLYVYIHWWKTPVLWGWVLFFKHPRSYSKPKVIRYVINFSNDISRVFKKQNFSLVSSFLIAKTLVLKSVSLFEHVKPLPLNVGRKCFHFFIAS